MVINGIEYIERPQQNSKNIKRLLPYMAIAAMFGGFKVAQTNTPYNLIEEFTLIQNKKSNLSRSEREQVIRDFNRKYQIK